MDLEFDFLGNPIGGHITTCKDTLFYILYTYLIYITIYEE